MRWMVLAIAAGLVVVVVYLGSVAFISALAGAVQTAAPGQDPPPAAGASPPAPPTVRASVDAPSIPPPAVAIASPPPPGAPTPGSPPLRPSRASHQRPGKVTRRMRRILTGQLTAALSLLREQLARCPGRHAQAGFGGGSSDAPDLEEQPLLLLDVETLDGKVRIIDAPLAFPGSASGAFAACAQQVLRGQLVAVPAAVAGDHTRIALTVDSMEGEPPGRR